MNRSVGVLLALVAGACASSTEPSPDPGYRIVAFDGAMPANVEDTVGPHRLIIRRVVDDAREEELLSIAETLYPPIADIREASERNGWYGAEPLPERGAVWWYSSFDGIRLPYAVTAHAVAYYHDLSRAFEQGDSLAAGGIVMDITGFLYEADVEYHAVYSHEGHSYESVYVADLRLGWSNWCGDLCAMSTGGHRIVVFSDTGEVLDVHGDGVPPMVVS